MKSIFLYFLILLTFINVSFGQTKQEKLNDLLTVYAQLNTFNGSALIYHKGICILNQGYGFRNTDENAKNYSNTSFQIGSLTKQFTATIILKLQEQGKLKLTDKLSYFFPKFPKGDSITIHHLLTHTSGIYNYTDDANFMQSELEKSASREKMMALFENKPLEFSPGSKMKYCNSGYLLLGYIIEILTDTQYEKVVKDWIFKPLNMAESGFDFKNLRSPNKAIGYANFSENKGKAALIVDSTISFAGGALYSTTLDLLKWHLGLLNNNIIKRKTLELAFAPYNNNFGYGWVIDTFYEKKGVFHNGSIPGFTSNIYRIEADNTCIILLNNTPNRNIDTITKNLLCILYDKPYHQPKIKQEIALDQKTLSKYIGTYEFSPNFLMNIFSNDNHTYAQRIGDADKFEIFAHKENSFFLKAFEAELEFRENGKHLIDTMILHQGGKDMVAIKTAKKVNSLYDEILKMDNDFSEAYNSRDIGKLKALFNPELDFYHDKTGHSNYTENIKVFTENFGARKKIRRELLKESTEVYPINNFGALEIGVHKFYVTQEGQQEQFDSSPKFIHIWKKTGDKWELIKIVSFNH
jgi:CubicO group peptidase (beta-lactamase class C family)